MSNSTILLVENMEQNGMALDVCGISILIFSSNLQVTLNGTTQSAVHTALGSEP